MGLWVRAHATVKNMGSVGDSDAEKGGLLSLTYASPPEWDCPPPGRLCRSHPESTRGQFAKECPMATKFGGKKQNKTKP